MNANTINHTHTLKTPAALSLKLALGMGLCTPALVSAQTTPAVSKSTVPAGVAGRWIATSIGTTTYSDRNTGRFLGNGRQSAQIYEFDGQGGFTYYMTMEVRTGNYVSRVRNNYKGTVTFTANTFTLHPTSGHYHTEIGSRITDRAMTDEDLAKIAKPLNWRLDKGADGKPRFLMPFSDGSKSEFKPLSDTASDNSERKK